MATIEGRAHVSVTATFQFDEPELRALNALTAYGSSAFLKVFYEHLGKTELYPHEAGLRSLFDSIKQQMGGILRRADDSRKVFDQSRVAVLPRTIEQLSEAANEKIAKKDAALRYALPLLQKYGHTQGDNAEYRAELVAPVLAALSELPASEDGSGSNG